MEHADRETLEDGLDEIRRAPSEVGTVELIVRRPEVEAREVVSEAQVDPVDGLVGDCWRTRGSSSTEDGAANPDAQITVMNARVTALVARDPARRPAASARGRVPPGRSRGRSSR